MQNVSCVCNLWFGLAVGIATARVVISQTDRLSWLHDSLSVSMSFYLLVFAALAYC